MLIFGLCLSVKWDKAGIMTVEEKQCQEQHTCQEQERTEGSKTKHESHKLSKSHRCTPISKIFPEVQRQQRNSATSLSPSASIIEHLLVRVKNATTDCHSPIDDEELQAGVSLNETLVKHTFPRPMSEQLLG